MATTDERDAGAVDATDLAVADGDDITVIPDPPARRARRGRPAVVGIVTVAAAAIVVVAALALRTDGSKPPVRVASPPAQPAVDKVASPSTAKHATATTAPHLTPSTAAAPVVAPHASTPTVAPAVVTSPPQTAPANTPATTAAPAKQYGASVLTWDAPRTLTIPHGTTTTVSVTAHNPTDGTVTLAHPLSCTPRLDHSEMCPEMVQLIAPGGSASARYTVDASGTHAGEHYTLNVEGVLAIAVTIG